MTEFYSKDFYDNNMLTINASIIDKCNYSCAYCCNQFPRTSILMNLKNLKTFIEFIHNQHRTKQISVTLIGGEPLLHPDIYWFCDEMHKHNIICNIYSNFSFDYEAYALFNKNVIFTCSWHNNQTSTKFISNIYKIPKEQLNRYSFYIMYEHDNIDLSINVFNEVCKITNKVQLKKIFNTHLYNKIYSNDDNIKFDRIIQLSKTKKMTVEDTYIFNNKNKSITIQNIQIDEGINPFKHWKCYAGRDNLHISNTGDIYPCVTFQPLSNNTIDIQKKSCGNIKYFKSATIRSFYICDAPRCCDYEIKKQNILNIPLHQYFCLYV